jgi:hypothetical protein
MPDRVYAVMQDVPYDSCGVVAIFAKAESAERLVEKLKKETPSWNYFVETHEVKDD